MNMTATRVTAAEVVTVINDAMASGATVRVNGREVWSRWTRNRCAEKWGNGSASVTVRGRKAGTEGTVWVKAGQTVTVEVAR